MTVVVDAEPLLAFAFDEQGAGVVERWLDQVYDGEINGYVTTLNLAEFRYVATRKASVEQADAHIDALRDLGLTEYDIDDLWETAADVKATYSPSIGDAYAVAAAKDLDNDAGRDVTLLVGADDDYDVFEDEAAFEHLIERFRDKSA
jgi:ribonuclease VapC